MVITLPLHSSRGRRPHINTHLNMLSLLAARFPPILIPTLSAHPARRRPSYRSMLRLQQSTHTRRPHLLARVYHRPPPEVGPARGGTLVLHTPIQGLLGECTGTKTEIEVKLLMECMLHPQDLGQGKVEYRTNMTELNFSTISSVLRPLPVGVGMPIPPLSARKMDL